MKRICIIGGGFSGGMTAVQLIRQTNMPIEIHIVNPTDEPLKGAAYASYSNKHLLNVISSKMSAFQEEPDHFLNWVMQEGAYRSKDRQLVAGAFLPRNIYGKYLSDIWKEAMDLSLTKGIQLQWHRGTVSQLDRTNAGFTISLSEGKVLSSEFCVIATGNLPPRNPSTNTTAALVKPYYFQNPWKADVVSDVNPNLPVLIIGNGLTMVDTVIGLRENGFRGVIYAVSPHGFNILPHRHNGMRYDAIESELTGNKSLAELVAIVNKHVKAVREFGISAEPVVDAIRPYFRALWQQLSAEEKALFMSRLRHLWGVARHRIPLHIHDKIQQQRLEGKLHVCSGKIQLLEKSGDGLHVTYFDKKENLSKILLVSRAINCTGPETDLSKTDGHFLGKCLDQGMITQDPLKLGIVADIHTFEVQDSTGKKQPDLFTLGSLLKGELWESTAVNELRQQAAALASHILSC
jgi:uncharacterized NAD(P)/FAD-binding protein YdhS